VRIVLLAHNLRVAGGLSVGKNIVATLPEIAPIHEYLMIVPAGCEYPDFQEQSNVSVVGIPAMGLLKRIAFDLFELPRIVRKFKPDWVWGLGNGGMLNPPCKQAILFHDAHHVYPETHYAFESWFYKLKKRLISHQLKRALPFVDVVFCQTETVRKRFSDVFVYPLNQISVCPNAVSNFSDIVDGELQSPSVLGSHSKRFKLFVLTKCYGHKNLSGIIDMYSKYREELSDTVCILTIAPDQHKIAPSILARIEKENLGDLILNVGPLNQEELTCYYQSCDVLFLPTLLESFSGTYLEAMHFGRPIITSDLDFAHDVCGDAALYCDPFDLESMKSAILKCKASSELRAELVAKGKKRMNSFFRTWPDILRDCLDRMEIPHD